MNFFLSARFKMTNQSELEDETMVELADIDSQAASTLVCDFMICARCGIVDRKESRLVVNSDCPACQRPAGVACLYYSDRFHILVDLMQQTYHSSGPVDTIISGPQAQNIGTIIFFCTLREALLNHFLLKLLLAQRVPARVIEKLFDDNKLANQKFNSLFPAVTGNSWKVAVQEASKYDDTNYNEISDLMREAADIRNKFMHEGMGWAATREVATNCINALFCLFSLFVALHNIYVRPHLRENNI